MKNSVVFRYNFGKHTYDENLQYIADLPEIECQRVDRWISDMEKLAQQSNNKYDQFDKARFRPLIGISFVRSFIQDMWVKVRHAKKIFIYII
jgi:hypothetical protein